MLSYLAQTLQLAFLATWIVLSQGGTTRDIFVPTSHNLLEMVYSDGTIEVGRFGLDEEEPALCGINPGFISVENSEGKCQSITDFAIKYGTANQITNDTVTTHFCPECKLTVVSKEFFELVPTTSQDLFLLAATAGTTFPTRQLPLPTKGTMKITEETYGTIVTLQPDSQITLERGKLCSSIDNNCKSTVAASAVEESFLYSEGEGRVLLTAGFKHRNYDDVDDSDQYLPSPGTKRSRFLIGLTYKSALESGLDTTQLFVNYGKKRVKRFGLGATAMGLYGGVKAQADNLLSSSRSGFSKAQQTQNQLSAKLMASNKVMALNMWNIGHVQTEQLDIRFNLGTTRALQSHNSEILGKASSKTSFIEDFFLFLISWVNTERTLEKQNMEEAIDVFKRNHTDLTVISAVKFPKGYMITASEELAGGNTGRDCRKACNLAGKWKWFQNKDRPNVEIEGPVITTVTCGVLYKQRRADSLAEAQVSVQINTNQAISQLEQYNDGEVYFIYTLGLDCVEDSLELNNEAFSKVSELLVTAGGKELEESQDGRYKIDCKGLDAKTSKLLDPQSFYCKNLIKNEELQYLAIEISGGRIELEDILSTIKKYLPTLKGLDDMYSSYTTMEVDLASLQKGFNDLKKADPVSIASLCISLLTLIPVCFLYFKWWRNRPKEKSSSSNVL